jgi:hypothetical protein
LFHSSGPDSVAETMYFGFSFRGSATGCSSSLAFGQWRANPSWVRRPSTNPPAAFRFETTQFVEGPSKYRRCQPPCSKPPLRSSSGSPGAWITPSNAVHS